MFYERNSVSRIPGPVFFPGFRGGAVGLEAGATFLAEGGVRGVVVPAVAAAEHAGGGAVYFAAVFGLFDSLLLLFPLLPLFFPLQFDAEQELGESNRLFRFRPRKPGEKLIRLLLPRILCLPVFFECPGRRGPFGRAIHIYAGNS